MFLSIRSLLNVFLALAVLSVVNPYSSKAAAHVDLFTDSCSVGTDYFEFRIFITNSSTAGETVYLSSSTFRMTHATLIVPAGSQTYDFSYVTGTCDAQFTPLYAAAGSTYNISYNPTSRLMQLTYSSSVFGNSSSPVNAPIAAGQTACLGQFRLTITSSPWVDSQPVGFGWSGTTSGITGYENTSTTIINFNTTANRTLGAMCVLTTPTSTGINASFVRAGLETFPNPCSTLLHVTGAGPGIPVRLFSGDGSEKACVSSDGSEALLDVRGLPRGLYVLEAGSYRRKIVIE
ncbi:MAG: hypothetical protein RL213_1019 [Bacteroidota bacterium]|jgi:hypothetical protein